MVECLTGDQRAVGLSLTSVSALCPWARNINPCLVLVQPRKTRPDITEKIVDWDVHVKNQIKQNTLYNTISYEFSYTY